MSDMLAAALKFDRDVQHAERPKSWLEYVDPVTGRKIDVVVSLHSSLPDTFRPEEVAIVNRFASYIEEELAGGSDGERNVVAELTDVEPAGLEEA